jgi:adenosine deaminase
MGVIADLERARLVPKSLLHDHLDGGLRPTTVLELADSIGWVLPADDAAALQAWCTRGADTKDLLQYLACFEHTLAVMQTEEQIERVAFEAAEDLGADGVVYAELRFAPELHQANGLPLEAVCAAVTAGFRRAEGQVRGSIVVNAILCAMRTEQRSLEIARLVDRLRETDDKIVGFDLAGAETGWPPSLHKEALAFARQRHLNITIHASEPPDLELISDALAHGTHRIGHGVRLQRDAHIDEHNQLTLGPLARHILDHQIHLEMAPTCHVHVGAVASLDQHPVARFLRAGFNVSVNTDNRLMSNVMPSSELLAVSDTFDLTWNETEQLVTNGVMSGFAPIEQRHRIVREQIRRWFATQTQQPPHSDQHAGG